MHPSDRDRGAGRPTIGARRAIGPLCQVGPDVGASRTAPSWSATSWWTASPGSARARVLYPFCTVGLAPQDLKYKGEPTRCEIGARTQMREHVTIHRGTVTGTGVTRVGADCLLMAVAHVAHDCVLGTA